jgi:competence protein ComEC
LSLCVACGCLAGSSFHLFTVQNTLYTGIPADKVRSITAVLVQDGKVVTSGDVLYRARIQAVSDNDGTRATASGVIPVFAGEADPHLWGTTIELDAVLRHRRETNTWIAYKAGGEVSEVKPAPPLFNWRAAVRTLLLEKIDHIEGNGGRLFRALFLGLRDSIEERDVRIFRESGCIHLLALSGMHLGVISALLALLLVPVLGRKTGFITGVVVIMLYIFIVGLKPSLMRAGIMYVLLGAGLIMGRRVNGMVILLASFVILAVTYPDSASTLSFQLSFSALAGIIIAGNRCARLFRRFLPPAVSLPIACSIGAQLFTAPLLLSTFAVLYPAGIFTSLLLTPLVTMFMWIGVLLLLQPSSVILEIGSAVLDRIYSLIVSIAEYGARLPAVEIHDADRYPFVYAVIAALIVVICLPYRQRKG